MKKFMLVPIIVALTACSGMTTLKTENSNSRQVPSWYLDHADTGSESRAWYKPWDTEGYYYAVAEDVSPSMEMAVKKAMLKAKAKIADRVTGEMNNRTSIEYKETGNPDRPTGTSTGQDVIVNTITDTILRTYSVQDKMVVFNKDVGNYRAFVMIKISQADVQAVAAAYDAKKAKL
jgi:hypothetical protein